MSRILLLIERKENRRLLFDLLRKNHEILLPDEKNTTLEFLNPDSGAYSPSNSFDLCILDSLTLDRLSQWVQNTKESQQPVFLPFVLLASRQQVGIATRHLWKSIDELIITPVEKVELQARLEILLRSRQLSLQLQAANKELQKNSEVKSNLISMVSHEFGNPIAAILGVAKILQQHLHELPSSKIQDYLKLILSSVKRMTTLTEDLLVVGRLDLGKLNFNPAPLNLEIFCQDIVEEIEINSNEKQSTIYFQISYSSALEKKANLRRKTIENACLDENLMRHILSNLLSNAIKYSPAGATVRFDVICGDREVIFQIKDEGIGIPQKDQEQLFEAFHRASNVGKIAGNGLGLCIVKQCVDLHGGTIEFSSAVGVGTTFKVTLPLSNLEREF